MSESLGRRLVVNTGALAGANLWRIVVSFLLQLIIARRLGLETLGAYTVAMAFLNVSQVLCELGLPLWMVREVAGRPAARRAYWLRGMALQGGMAFLLWGGLLLLTLWLPYSPELRRAIGWVGASLPLYAVSAAAGMVFQASERMPLLLRVEAVTNSLILAISVGVVLAAGNVSDLLLVVVAAQAISAALSLWWLTRSGLPAAAQSAPPPWREIGRGAAPFFGLSMADVLLQRLDILLLSLLGDPRLIGLYSAAYNLTRVVIKLVQSYWRGLYPTLSRLRRENPPQGHAVVQSALRYAVLLCCGGAAITTGVAGELLHLVYGSREPAATPVLAWLVWSVPLFCVEFYASTRLLVEGRARAALCLALGHVAGLAVLLLPLAAQAGALGAAWAVLIAQACATLGGLWLLGERADRASGGRLAALGLLTAGATVLTLWLPDPAWLRAGAAGAGYLAGLQAGGLLTPRDWRRVRSLLRPGDG